MSGERKSGNRTKAAKARRRRACPMCGKPAVEPFAPFCSRACTDRDLGLWLQGAYRIPAVEPPDDLDDAMRENEGAGGDEPDREDDRR